MMGSGHDEQRGVIPRLCEEIFERIKTNTVPGWTGKVEVSYMEIYLEKVRDLLSPDQSRKPRVREHAITGPYVEDLTSHAVNDFHAINSLMDEGNKVSLCICRSISVMLFMSVVSFSVVALISMSA